MIKPFVKKLPLFFISTILATTVGYSFHFIIARHLGPSVYGKYSILMAVMLVLCQPLESLSLAVARVIIERGKNDWKVHLFGFLKLSLVIGILLGGILYVGILIYKYQHNDFNQLAVLFGSLTLFLWSFLFVFKGFCQGLHKEIGFAFSRSIELFGRLCTGFFVVILKKGLAGAIFSSLLGAIGGIAYILFVLKKSLSGWMKSWIRLKDTIYPTKNDFSNKVYYKQFFRILLMSFPLGLFIRLDMILVNKILGVREAGIYAIANLIGKGILFYSFGVIPLIYPYLVKYRIQKQGWQFLTVGFFYTSVIFGATFLFFLCFGQSVIPFFFGNLYQDAAKLLPYYIIAIFPIALHCNIINFKLAIGGWWECLLLWIGVLIYFLILYFSPLNIKDYLFRIGVSHLALMISGITLLIIREKRCSLEKSQVFQANQKPV